MSISFACIINVLLIATQPAEAAAEPSVDKAPEATPIESLTLDLGKLPKEVKYKIGRIGENNSVIDIRGTIVAKTSVLESSVEIEDAFTRESSDETATLKETCAKDSLLTLQRAEGIAPDGDGFNVLVEDGKVKFQPKSGDASEDEFAKNSITRSAFLRIITLLPREKDKTYSFGNLLRPDHYKTGDGPYVVECKGEESLDRGAGPIACTKFELHTEKDTDRQIVEFLVSADGLLQRMTYDGREVTDLVTEADKPVDEPKADDANP